MPTSLIKKVFICFALVLFLAGCVETDAENTSSSSGGTGIGGGTGSGGSGGGGTDGNGDNTLRGSVGDGPVINATITVLDNNGIQVATGSSDSNANYELTVPAGTVYPVTVVTSGGTDTVTNDTPTFSMSSVALDANADITNITPFSTFIVENAKRLPGGINAGNVNQATNTIVSQLNFGLDTSLGPNPISTPVSDQNVAVIIKASEALGELVRRIQNSLQSSGTTLSQAEIISGLSADLADGVIDGLGAGSNTQLAATSNIVSAQVTIETLSNSLMVNGTSAVAAMDNAINIVQPGSSTTTADVLINVELITQSQIAVAAAQSIAPSQTLTDTAAGLSSLSANSSSADAAAAIPAGAGSALDQAETTLTTASPEELDSINETIRNNTGGNTPVPTITFSSNSTSIDFNSNVTLNWAANDATSCTAAGSWSGNKTTSGTESVGPFTSDANFTISCSGIGGQSSANISIDVGEPPTSSPTVSISATPSSISYNGSTVLSWSSTNADSCAASGDWSGSKNTNGSQTISSLLSNSTFTLSCTNGSGSASQTVNVAVSPPPAPVVSLSASNTNIAYNGSTTLNWSSNNASSCSASGNWSGTKSTSGSQTISQLTEDSTFVLSRSGVGGTADRTVVISVDAPAPTLSLSASTNSVDYNGSTTLNWSSSNTTSCSATGDWTGTKSTSGSQSVSDLTTNSSFTLTCSGPSGNVTQTVNVAVGSAPEPILSLSINKTTVAYNGAARLTWSSSHASACSASGDWSGSKATSGSQSSGSLTTNSSFTLTCSNAAGNTSKSVDVSVGSAPAPATILTVDSSTVAYQGSATLNWTSSNTTGCVASGDWSGNKASSGSQTMSSLIADSSFTLTCTGSGGGDSKTVSVNVLAPIPTASLSASSTSVAYNGSTVLTWSSNNTNSCTASGSQTINSLTANSSFTISCTGPGGDVSKTVDVNVATAPSPTVSLAASNTSVESNGSTTLNWSSSNADSCVVSGDWSGTKNTSGSQTISAISADSRFTLTCTGAGGNANQSVDVTVTVTNGTALLSWTPPTTNTDGSSLTDLAGYKIYYGQTSGNYSETVTVNNPGLSSYQLDSLTAGTWYFAISAFDTSGNESTKSNEASKTIN